MGIHPETLIEWEKRYPEFSESTTRARVYALAWYLAHCRKNLENRDFNAALAKVLGCAQFPEVFRDSVKVEHSGSVDSQVEVNQEVRVKVISSMSRIIPALEPPRICN